MNNLPIPEFGISVTYRIELAQSRCEILQPTLYLRFDPRSPARACNAALHLLASRLEAATPPTEGWVVCIERHSDDAASIHLELFRATEDEAARGMVRLRQITQW